MFSQSSYIEALTTHVTVLEIGTLRRSLRLDEVIRVERLCYRNDALIRRGTIALSPTHEDIAKKCSSASHEESPHQNMAMLAP